MRQEGMLKLKEYAGRSARSEGGLARSKQVLQEKYSSQ